MAVSCRFVRRRSQLARMSRILAVAVAGGTLCPATRAAVTVDNTPNFRAGPVTRGSGGVYNITPDLGRMSPRGDPNSPPTNLFHSFSEFNLATGETASFSGPTSIKNVLTRV